MRHGPSEQRSRLATRRGRSKDVRVERKVRQTTGLLRLSAMDRMLVVGIPGRRTCGFPRAAVSIDKARSGKDAATDESWHAPQSTHGRNRKAHPPSRWFSPPTCEGGHAIIYLRD
eukprot:926395-Prorocentrum_minimum.AAC.8